MTCPIESELGAFVLHALEPEEAESVSAHLITCRDCSKEAESLAATAGLMGLLRAADFERLGDPCLEEGQPSVKTGSRLRRTPLRRAARATGGVALVGAALTAAVLVGVTHPGQDSSPRSSQAVVRAVDPDTHVHAEVTMQRRDSGTKLGLTLTGAHPHGLCSLVARSQSGRTDIAATWAADAHGAAWAAGMTAIRADQLTELDVVTGTGRVLVRIPVPPQTIASDRS